MKTKLLIGCLIATLIGAEHRTQAEVNSGKLQAGTAKVDITPDEAVAVDILDRKSVV